MKTIPIAGAGVALLALASGAWGADSVAQIPGVVVSGCQPSPGPRPWLKKNQAPECRALEALAVLTPEERIHFGEAAFGPLGEGGGGNGASGGTDASGASGSGGGNSNGGSSSSSAANDGASSPPPPPSPEVVAARAASRSADEKLGLPKLGGGSDGPNGIADMSDLFASPVAPRSKDVTAFPNVITLGATWDRTLAARFGTALGNEFRGKGLTANLGPTMNLIRTWHGGRSAETYGEDPYLIGELAVPEILGMQAQGVIATIKHFAGNNQEASRVGAHPDMAGIDEHISEKALHEIYFPHFKAAVQRGRAGAVMCAYNKINGEFSCNDAALLGHLREWGFDGLIVPDAVFAQRDPVAAAKAGVDSVGPTSAVVKAMQSGEVDAHFFDRKVYRALVTRFRHGLYDNPTRGTEDAKVSSAEHVKLAREIAASGTVLLKNSSNVLPLDRAKSIAVIGADAGAEAVVMETGSPNVHVGSLSIPVDAIRARAGDKARVEYARGNVGVRALPAVPAEVLSPPSGKGHGLEGTYFGTPYFWMKLATRVDEKIELGADPGVPAAAEGLNGKREYPRGRDPWSVQWKGAITPPATGVYTFSLTGSGTAELYIDNKLVTTFQRADFAGTAVGTIALTAGRRTPVLIKYDTASAILGTGIKLGWRPPDSRLAEAVEAAKRAEVAVVFAGEQLGEGYDKISLNLPGDQDALIEAIAAANPRTVVVLHTSTAVAMPWIDKVAAVVEAWYPGQEAGNAIADVLFGDVNPSGKLPVTFPRDESQGPATSWMSYPGNGRSVQYSEGIFVGYRWYDAKNQQPLFPFGHGLSYTTFEYSDLELAEGVVRFKIKNTGTRAGAEVAQLYVRMPDALNEPPRQLKGFEKVMLRPGDSRTVSLPLPTSQLEVYDEAAGVWRLYGGQYSAGVGSSSRDIRLERDFVILVD